MKICQICQQDCASKPRVRDPEGNYYCKACLEQRKPGPPQVEADPGVAPDSRAGGAAEGGYGLAALMEDNGMGQGAVMCPLCGNAMRAGAALCIRCGYDPQKGKSLKTAVTVEKEPKEPRAARRPGAGVSMLSGLFDESPILPIASALVHGGLFVAAMDNDDMRMVYFGIAGVIWLGVLIWGLVLMFFESVIHAVAGFFCGLYWLYWVVMNSDNRALQWLTAVSVLAWVLGRAVLGFPEREF